MKYIMLDYFCLTHVIRKYFVCFKLVKTFMQKRPFGKLRVTGGVLMVILQCVMLSLPKHYHIVHV